MRKKEVIFMAKDIGMSKESRMGDRIKDYYNSIENMLDNPPKDIDYYYEMEKHLVQIEFFMHERLIHLIVTVTFAVLAIITILYTMVFPSIPMFGLVLLFFVLLIPYIKHYYLLENSVQKMYEQYDEMLKRKGQS